MLNHCGNLQLQRAVRVALASATFATIGVAHSQTPPASQAPAAGAALEEIVVTGSRIAVPNSVAISPVLAVTAVDIQQTGATRIEDMLNTLPQVNAAQGTGQSNGADGTAQVNLRGLGVNRTLVLVNGRRLGPGDPSTAGASDLNQVPAELIDRVEVLTGGASSVYGADAVAGVVNFVLNDHFEGVKLIGDYSFYQHQNSNNDGEQTAITDFNAANGTNFQQAPGNVDTGFTKDLGFIAGMNFADGKGNATFYTTYRNVASVLQAKYSESACTLNSGYTTSGGARKCGGSSNYDRFIDLNTGSDQSISPGGVLVPFSGAYRYNYGPLNYYQRPDERWATGGFLHYDMNDHVTVYSEMMYMNDRTISQIAPSGAFLAPTYYTNCNNPELSPSELASWCGGVVSPGLSDPLLIGRRNVEGSPRDDDLEHTSIRMVLGAKGKINDTWNYDVSGQHSIVQLVETYADASFTKIQDAIQVVNTPNGPQCAVNVPNLQSSGLAAGCVPWNIFGGPPGSNTGVTPASTNYISEIGMQRGQVDQDIFQADFTGDFGQYGVKVPTAKSGLKVNVGVDWMDTRSEFLPDAEFQDYDLTGQGGPILPVSGGVIAREGFFEGRLPLIDDMPGAQSLALEGGYRYSSYNLGFDTNTYKLGLEWTPVSDIRLRGSWSRAVRAPNVSELYSPQSVALDGHTDPCAGPAVGGLVNGHTLAACEQTGVTPAQFGNILVSAAAQYNGLTGGNPNLSPETAVTTDFGLGWTPSFLPNFRLQVDYYDITISQVVNTIGADTILRYCVQQDLFCNDVHRDPATGLLWGPSTGYVIDLLSNVGKLEEKGVDLDLSYGFDVGAAGKIHMNFVGTYIDSYLQTPIAANPSTQYDCAGYYGNTCSNETGTANTSPLPRWRHVFRTTWQTPWSGFDLSVAWRYIGPVNVDYTSSNVNLAPAAGCTIANGCVSNTDVRLSSRSYLDLTGSVALADHVTFRLGVNNLLDKDPPLIGLTNCPTGTCNGNTFPGTYDALGRYIFGTITAQF